MKGMRLLSAVIMGLAQSLVQGQADDTTAGESKSEPCAACHGPDGNSLVPEWPKLAGQNAAYISGQLAAFKSGAREDVNMNSITASLSEQDMEDLGAYYAGQIVEIGAADPDLVDAGQALYRGGNAVTGVPACMACHGPSGAGNPAAGYPALSGQHAAYTAKQLRAYRSESRSTDTAAVMRTIAGRLSEAEIDAVASYIAGLH